MRTTSLKSIYLKQHELKEAIIQHLFQCGHKELAEHLNMNECEMVWGQSGKEFIVSIDGEVEDDFATKKKDETKLPHSQASENLLLQSD